MISPYIYFGIILLVLSIHLAFVNVGLLFLIPLHSQIFIVIYVLFFVPFIKKKTFILQVSELDVDEQYNVVRKHVPRNVNMVRPVPRITVPEPFPDPKEVAVPPFLFPPLYFPPNSKEAAAEYPTTESTVEWFRVQSWTDHQV